MNITSKNICLRITAGMEKKTQTQMIRLRFLFQMLLNSVFIVQSYCVQVYSLMKKTILLGLLFA